MTVILAIETSCDECAAALVRADKTILSSTLHSQLETHEQYGGVVPELAARAHLAHIQNIVATAMHQAGCGYGDLAAVAATIGPGLIGGVLVGANFAKAIALARNLPFIGVNHLEGHALTCRLTDEVEFPFLLLLVSGGHTQILAVLGVGQYRQLGTTRDDALGESFDKVAKMLGLGYPGGPALEKAAKSGDDRQFDLPRPMVGRRMTDAGECDFSFSGLKTAVRRQIEKWTINADTNSFSQQDQSDMAASFQRAASDCVVDRLRQAMIFFRQNYGGKTAAPPCLVVAGGVAANQVLRRDLSELAAEMGYRSVAPPLALCTDNAAMIGWAAMERYLLGQRDDLTIPTRPRWPLDPTANGEAA
ncbi:MAG: tRNA (adenosine(37)-N6)-threonylcarbamoyltransferase complex transferase subunit TsaD [Alphaproteobacteria bacterium]|nr:tRNA (adenosine(37)-N6)-threonylcarbamoyltransferase complex transferase subunit TsaD [Alphaproteobacteria bacterium]